MGKAADMFDCVIIGGGPAGLTAATYLGRFRRRALLVDEGGSRLKRIPCSHNVPGFPEGISGKDLHERLEKQAQAYRLEKREGRIDKIERDDSAFALVLDSGQRVRSSTILLATGAEMAEPDIPDLEAAVASGLVRYCPICDGYEARDKCIAVLGGRPGSIDEALFLKTYSSRLTFVPADAASALDAREKQKAREEDVEVEARVPARIERLTDAVRMRFADGHRDFDIVYPCLGTSPRSELAGRLGADLSRDGGIVTDRHQETSIRGLFAAGDVLKGLDQIASACGQAAIAATAIHNRLRGAG